MYGGFIVFVIRVESLTTSQVLVILARQGSNMLASPEDDVSKCVVKNNFDFSRGGCEIDSL
jgi:hypothetical protein